MSSNRKILALLLVSVVFANCRMAVEVPKAYNFTKKEIYNNPYGCWTIVDYNAKKDTLSRQKIEGELLFLDKDSVCLLVDDGKAQSINVKSVIKVELVTHKNQSGTYLLLTAIYLLPNILGVLAHGPDWAFGYFAMGIPTAMGGIINSLVEANARKNVLTYPDGQKLDEFKIFARFPAEKPEGIDYKQLSLKKVAKKGTN